MKEMIRRFGDVGGGGLDASLRLFAVLGAVALTVLAGVMVLDDGADAALFDDPYGPIPPNYVYEGLVFNDHNGDVEVTGYSEEPAGALSIPSSFIYGGHEYDVVSIGDIAFIECSGLTSVTIPDSVNSIGMQAFYGCQNLTSVTIPDSVTSIGEGVFEECSDLASVTIPNSLTYISGFAFNGCQNLTSVTIPESITFIDECAFQDSGLTSVIFQSDVAPTFNTESFRTGTIINVYTPGWDPVSALANTHGDETTIVWANLYSDLEFTSDPIADGIYTYVGPKPLETN